MNSFVQDASRNCRFYIHQGEMSFTGSFTATPHDDESHTFISATHALRSMKTTTNVTRSGP